MQEFNRLAVVLEVYPAPSNKLKVQMKDSKRVLTWPTKFFVLVAKSCEYNNQIRFLYHIRTAQDYDNIRVGNVLSPYKTATIESTTVLQCNVKLLI